MLRTATATGSADTAEELAVMVTPNQVQFDCI
jgi:hypothetical protein